MTTSEQARKIAAEALPCDSGTRCNTHAPGSGIGSDGHRYGCPAFFRPAVAAAIEKLLADHERIEQEQLEYWSLKHDALQVQYDELVEWSRDCSHDDHGPWCRHYKGLKAERDALKAKLDELTECLALEAPVKRADEDWWWCLVGPAHPDDLPGGADVPMRQAVEAAFLSILSHSPLATFSGWGHSPTEPQRAVVENRTTNFDYALRALDEKEK